MDMLADRDGVYDDARVLEGESHAAGVVHDCFECYWI
jgi:hypothetical protein